VKRSIATLKAVWHYEPVLVAALPAVLITIGLTTAEAKNVTDVVSGALATLMQVGLALAARRKVAPTAKPTETS
jgi:hypothetical protein